MEENNNKNKKQKKSGLSSTILLLAVFLIGLCVMLYPTVSDFWNEKRQSQAIMNYDDLLVDLTPEDFSEYFEKAEEYNRKLKLISYPFLGYPELDDEYYSALDVNDDGMMGYITIDKIKVQLPIYHGTSDKVLNCAVGHLEGSTLPIGGESTHCVLSAHRGLPSAKLFTNLDELAVGDVFTITILDKMFTYQVDQVLIGSCTNSSLLDMLKVAEILDGKTVHPDVSLSIAPGSKQVLNMLAQNGALSAMIDAGARILESACGPCIGMGQSPNSRGISLRTRRIYHKRQYDSDSF